MFQLTHRVATLSIKPNDVVMELKQRLTMWYCQQGYP